MHFFPFSACSPITQYTLLVVHSPMDFHLQVCHRWGPFLIDMLQLGSKLCVKSMIISCVIISHLNITSQIPMVMYMHRKFANATLSRL